MGMMICTDEKPTFNESEKINNSGSFSYLNSTLNLDKTISSSQSFNIQKIRFATMIHQKNRSKDFLPQSKHPSIKN